MITFLRLLNSSSAITMLINWILCVFGVMLIINYYWKRRKLYQAAVKIPGPRAFPIIGSAHLFICFDEILENAVKVLNQYGSTVKFWVFTVLVIVVTKPQHVQVVLNSPSCSEREKRYDFAKECFGDGLLTASGNTWKTHRKIITPTFNQRILESFMEIFVKQSEILVKQLEKELTKNAAFDVHEYLSRCSLDIICETAMGTKVEAQTTHSELLLATRRASQILVERSFRVWLHPNVLFWLSSRGREFKKILQYVHNYTGNMVMERYKEVHSNKEQIIFDDNQKKPFLEHLISLDKLTLLELRNEVDVFMTAGSDTVTTTTGYVLVCLGMYRDIQEKVVAELDEIFGKTDRPITNEDITKLVYLDKVIKETMRIYPPVPFVARSVSEDVDLGDLVLPAGSSVVVGIIGTNRNPEIYTDPMKFDPERFAPQEVAKRHPYSYIPFSAGPRNCIGMKFGMVSTKVILSNILRAYKIDTNIEPSEIRLSVEIVSKMIGGSNIIITKRQQ